MGAPVIRAAGLGKRVDGRTLLRGIDLEIARGSIVALLGANGAGKSTLLRVLSTLVPPSSGLGFLTVGSLVVFAAGYRRLLRERMPDSLVPQVAYTALTATAGALIIAAVLRAMLFDTLDAYDNSTLGVFYALSWDVSLASWTLLFVPAIASAIAAFRGVLPKWFGWLSIVTAALSILLMMVGLAFPAHMPGFIWLVAASIVALRAEPAR